MRDDGAIGRWARRESEIRKQVVERLITILLLGIYLGAAIAGIVTKNATNGSVRESFDPVGLQAFVYPALAVVATLNVALVIRTGSLDRWSDVYALVVWRRWITNTARLIGLVAVAIATLSWSKVAVSNWMLTVGLTIAALLCATLAAAAPEEPSVSDQRVLEYVAKHEATARMRLYMWNNRILNGGGVPVVGPPIAVQRLCDS